MHRAGHPIRAAALALAALALLAVAGTGSAAAATTGLARFRSCADLTSYVRAHAPFLARAYASSSGHGIPLPDVGTPSPEAPTVPGFITGGAGGAVDHSGTNDQEAGVDEPDLVKTDGQRMFVIEGGALQVLDVTGAEPKLVATISLPTWASDGLLLFGDRLLVLGQPREELRGLRSRPGAPLNLPQASEQLILLDVSDLARVHVLDRIVLSGSLLGARLTGSTVRVVTQSSPSLALRRPDVPVDGARPAVARAAWRQALRRSTAANWLPTRKKLRAGRPGTLAPALGCSAIERPQEFSGVGTVTVSTIDLTHGLAPVDVDAVLADGGIVYASPGAVYVATQRAFDTSLPETGPPPALDTVIHRFDTSSPTATEYGGSASVRGSLLNSYALSEADGVLRVATTEVPPWWTDSVTRSESFVTTFALSAAGLSPLGQVGGLGHGERIYATRFIGDRAYVVTFRQVDPLYVVDLADPAQPAVRGELELRGYSAYLHPVGDGLLLGIGQDATAEGRTTGTQVSLFDVSDPAAPARLSVLRMPGGWSDAEWDTHAFLFWPATSLAVLPVSVSASEAGDDGFTGAVGLTVTRAGGVTELGRIAHPQIAYPVPSAPSAPVAPGDVVSTYDYPTPIQRAVVVRDELLTISTAGIRTSRLTDLGDVAWLAFPVTIARPPGPIVFAS